MAGRTDGQNALRRKLANAAGVTGAESVHFAAFECRGARKLFAGPGHSAVQVAPQNQGLSGH